MINIYRPTRFPDRDAIIFQADTESVQKFNNTFFPVKAQPTKVDGIEGGYYAFLRYQYREEFFESIMMFLRTHYATPVIQVSAYRSDQPLPKTWKADVWKKKISDSIKNSFQKKGFSVRENEYSKVIEVLPEKPNIEKDGLEVFWGCQFWVEVNEDFFADIWASGNFWFYQNEQSTNFEKMALSFGDSSQIIKEIRGFTARSSEEQFAFLQRFIARIGKLEDCEGIQFQPSALTTSELGMETWFWLHDSDTALKGASEYPSIFTQSLLDVNGGFYHQPDDIAVLVLIPEAGTSSAIPVINWEVDFAEKIKGFIERVMPQVKVPFQVIKYPVTGSLDGAIGAVQAFATSQANRRILCFLPTPGSTARNSLDEQVIAADQQTFKLERDHLRPIFNKGFTETLDWNNLADSYSGQYVIDNAVMTGLYRFGALPWILTNLPFEGKPTEPTYFLGMEGNLKRGTVAAVIIDAGGKLIAYGANCPNGSGVDLINSTINLITDLLKNGFHQSQPRPTYLIVHLSPELEKFAKQIDAHLQQNKLTADVISIHHDTAVRMRQPDNKEGTPSNGIAIGNAKQKFAYLMNTLSVKEKTKRGTIHPSPAPIKILHWAGTTSLKTLAAHVYWLSVAHIHSLHRTVDLPITIAYAHALHSHLIRKKDPKPIRVTKNHNRTLFWL